MNMVKRPNTSNDDPPSGSNPDELRALEELEQLAAFLVERASMGEEAADRTDPDDRDDSQSD